MIKKVVNVLCFLIPWIFIFLVGFYYFSEKNINFINKSRAQDYSQTFINITKLRLLKNDTSNIIEYSNDSNEKKKKYNKFFDLIGK
jgi:hypothetical protein